MEMVYPHNVKALSPGDREKIIFVHLELTDFYLSLGDREKIIFAHLELTDFYIVQNGEIILQIIQSSLPKIASDHLLCCPVDMKGGKSLILNLKHGG